MDPRNDANDANPESHGDEARRSDPTQPTSAPSRGTLERARSVLLERMQERLTFARTSMRLYDALLSRHPAWTRSGYAPSLGSTLAAFRDDERAHVATLCDAVIQQGGSLELALDDTPGLGSRGLLRIVEDARTTLSQVLSAILVLELLDQDGWALLVRLATLSGEPGLARRFDAARLRQERHVAVVRALLREVRASSAERVL